MKDRLRAAGEDDAVGEADIDREADAAIVGEGVRDANVLDCVRVLVGETDREKLIVRDCDGVREPLRDSVDRSDEDDDNVRVPFVGDLVAVEALETEWVGVAPDFVALCSSVTVTLLVGVTDISSVVDDDPVGVPFDSVR